MADDRTGLLPDAIINNPAEILRHIHGVLHSSLILGGGIIAASTSLIPTDSTTAAADQIRTTSLDATPFAIKATAGNLYGFNILNATATVKYVKFVDEVTGSTIVGATPVVATLRIPGNSTIYVDATCVQYVFATAITAYAVTGGADTATVGVPANTIMVDFKYK